MNEKTHKTPKPKIPQTREQRLKASLKANMGKRKAQARARAADNAGKTEKE